MWCGGWRANAATSAGGRTPARRHPALYALGPRSHCSHQRRNHAKRRRLPAQQDRRRSSGAGRDEAAGLPHRRQADLRCRQGHLFTTFCRVLVEGRAARRWRLRGAPRRTGSLITPVRPSELTESGAGGSSHPSHIPLPCARYSLERVSHLNDENATATYWHASARSSVRGRARGTERPGTDRSAQRVRATLLLCRRSRPPRR